MSQPGDQILLSTRPGSPGLFLKSGCCMTHLCGSPVAFVHLSLPPCYAAVPAGVLEQQSCTILIPAAFWDQVRDVNVQILPQRQRCVVALS